MKTPIKLFLIMMFLLSWFSLAAADNHASSEDVNNSNNPLHPALGFNIQDSYTGSFHGLEDSDANSVLLRGIVPHKLFGAPQIMRATLPVATSPDEPLGSTTGLGDLNLFNIFIFKENDIQLGIGPQLTIPTADDDRTLGTEKMQLGGAGVVIAPQDWGLLGTLVTWQHSIGGSRFRETQNALQTQPFFIYNFPMGFFFRSTAIMNFNFEDGSYFIPVGTGFGKVWKLKGGTTINLFTEPQWTLWHDDIAPKFQLFSGINLQFPLT